MMLGISELQMWDSKTSSGEDRCRPDIWLIFEGAKLRVSTTTTIRLADGYSEGVLCR